MSIPESVFSRRIVVVTGKGGVGKTTVCASLGLAFARRGRRACLVEINGQGRFAQMFGLAERSYAPRAVAPGVETISLTVNECLDDFARRKLKMDTVVRLLFRTRAVTGFLDAVPGLHDLFQLGKIENLLMDPHDEDPHYDAVIIDAPSTGHGLSMLSSARTMADLVRVGRFHELASTIERLFGDPEKTTIVVVTLPEELPVNETMEFVAALGQDKRLLSVVVANRYHAAPVPKGLPWELMEPLLRTSADPDLRQLHRLALTEIERQDAEGTSVSRLAASLDGLPVAVLPWVPGDPRHVFEVLSRDLVGEDS